MRLVIIFALCVLATPAFADQDKPAIEYERQESLEIPGLTAGCHICEWRPQLNNMPAPDQCGTDATGEPLVGLFQCGYSEDCQRICNFLGCEER